MSSVDGGIDIVVAHLWNPHAEIILRVRGMYITTTTGALGIQIIRTSTQGSGGGFTTLTDEDSDFERRGAAPSGALLRGETATPAVQEGPPLFVHTLGATTSMREWKFAKPGILVPAGTGLGFRSSGGSSNVFQLGFEWEE